IVSTSVRYSSKLDTLGLPAFVVLAGFSVVVIWCGYVFRTYDGPLAEGVALGVAGELGGVGGEDPEVVGERFGDDGEGLLLVVRDADQAGAHDAPMRVVPLDAVPGAFTRDHREV